MVYINLFPQCKPVNEDSRWGKLWMNTVKPSLSFSTAKQVELRDWRLGLTLRILQLIILGYTAFVLVVDRQYLLVEVPSGKIDVRGEDDGTFKAAKRADYEKMLFDNDTNVLCASYEKYNYLYDENRNISFTGCNYPVVSEIMKMGTESLFLATQTRYTARTYLQADRPFSTNCTDLFREAGLLERCTKRRGVPVWTEGNGNGRCLCESGYYTLPVAMENVSIVLDHSYSTSWGEAGDLPETVLRLKDSEVDLKVWSSGTQVQAYLWELLQWMDVDLDQSFDALPNRNWVNDLQLDSVATQGSLGKVTGKYPMLRTMGMRVDVRVKYYNYDQAPNYQSQSEAEMSKVPAVVCILELDPQLSWTTLGSDFIIDPDTGEMLDVFSYGVLFHFKVSGMMGSFNFFLLLSAVINGLVLLRISNSIVMFLASYCMGLKSPFFKTAIKEKVTFKEEYTRFASQIVSAVSVFDQLDVDKTESLDKFELYSMIRQVHLQNNQAQGTNITHKDTMSLVGFLMSASEELDGPELEKEKTDEEEAQVPEVPEEMSINNPEWVAAFTGSRCTMHTFQQYVRRKQRMGMYIIDDKEEIKQMLEIDKELKAKLGMEVKEGRKNKDRAPVSYGSEEKGGALEETQGGSENKGGDTASLTVGTLKKNSVIPAPETLPVDSLSPEARAMIQPKEHKMDRKPL